MLGLRHAVEAQESGGTIIVPGSAQKRLPCRAIKLSLGDRRAPRREPLCTGWAEGAGPWGEAGPGGRAGTGQKMAP